MGSAVVARGLSCPTAGGILVPRPGMEPTSPALEGGFFTTGPPGKSLICFLNYDLLQATLDEDVVTVFHRDKLTRMPLLPAEVPPVGPHA